MLTDRIASTVSVEKQYNHDRNVMFNVILITAVFCYFHMLFLWSLKNVEMSIKNLTALRPKKKMTLTELHFSVQISLQLKMYSTAHAF